MSLVISSTTDTQEQVLEYPIQAALECGVPLQIAQFRLHGGPQPIDIDTVREFASDLACRGDVLMYGSQKKGEAASLMNRLIFAIAVMAFQPGGVKAFGLQFDASA